MIDIYGENIYRGFLRTSYASVSKQYSSFASDAEASAVRNFRNLNYSCFLVAPTSCEVSRASFVNSHEVVEGSASFGTAKLYALIGFSKHPALLLPFFQSVYENSMIIRRKSYY